MKAFLENQTGGGPGAVKVKKEIVKQSPKSKALKKMNKDGGVLVGAGKDGDGIIATAVQGSEGGDVQVVKKPHVNPMLGLAGGSAMPRPPNPMLAAIQARNKDKTDDGEGGEPRPKSKKIPPPIPKTGGAAAAAGGNPPRPPMGGMFADITKNRID